MPIPPHQTTCLRALLVAAAVAALLGAGCVQRRMTIRSNPPGALVYIDDYEVGTTPVSTNFTYYGTRKIRLVKDGFETLTVMQPIPPPWYEYFPIDFISENFVPGEIRDHRSLEFRMQPQMVAPTEQLLGRAEGLRAQTQTSGVVQTTPVAPRSPAGPIVQPGPQSVQPAPQPGFAIPGGVTPSTEPGGTIPQPIEPPGGWR